MVKSTRNMTFVIIAISVMFLTGCAISGSGNPVNTSNTDSNNVIDYLNQKVTVTYPEEGPLQPKKLSRRAKLKGKFTERI